jgi:hypothetical protein
LANLQDEQCIAHFTFAKEKVVLGDVHDWAEAKQILEAFRLDSAKDRHSLEKFDPRFLHGASLHEYRRFAARYKRNFEDEVDKELGVTRNPE